MFSWTNCVESTACVDPCPWQSLCGAVLDSAMVPFVLIPTSGSHFLCCVDDCIDPLLIMTHTLAISSCQPRASQSANTITPWESVLRRSESQESTEPDTVLPFVSFFARLKFPSTPPITARSVVRMPSSAHVWASGNAAPAVRLSLEVLTPSLPLRP